MFSCFVLMFRMGWLISVVVNVITGINLIKKVFDFVIENTKGSKLGDTIIPYINIVDCFINSVLSVMNKLAKWICPQSVLNEIKVLENKSLEESTNLINHLTNELNELGKKD